MYDGNELHYTNLLTIIKSRRSYYSHDFSISRKIEKSYRNDGSHQATHDCLP